jgi:hypothetical protein
VGASNDRFVLRDLSLPTRLVLSLFLISVGVGYFSALVQLHFAGGAKPGDLLPGKAEVETTYHPKAGDKPACKLACLIEAPIDAPFGGAGQMRAAFTTKSSATWAKFLEDLKDKAEKEKPGSGDAAVKQLLAEREGERLALLDWLFHSGNQQAYDKNDYALVSTPAEQPITSDYLLETKDGSPRRVKITSILADRCVDCHSPDGRNDKAKKFPLDGYDRLAKYMKVEQKSSGMSLDKLAQTTHVHLLGFSMLYGLTGLFFSLTTYPLLVRIVIAPLALLAQLADISCWWLARIDPMFAHVILITGGIVALSLAIQLIGTLFDMYDGKGKLAVLVLLVAGAGVAGVVHQKVIVPHLDGEKTAVVAN